MKLIEKIKLKFTECKMPTKQIKQDGFLELYVYQNNKQLAKDNSICCLFFNKSGTKIIDISIHSKLARAVYLDKFITFK